MTLLPSHTKGRGRRARKKRGEGRRARKKRGEGRPSGKKKRRAGVKLVKIKFKLVKK